MLKRDNEFNILEDGRYFFNQYEFLAKLCKI